MLSDFLSLVLQAAGGVVANGAATLAKARTGTNIMVAGLVFQVISLVIFIGLCVDFLLAVRRDQARIASTNWAAGGVVKPVAVRSLKVLIIGRFFLYLASNPIILHDLSVALNEC